MVATTLSWWAVPAGADSAPTAAEIDWRPRAELPEPVRAGLPVFCEGGYLPSTSVSHGPDDAGAMMGGASGGSAPVSASGLNARYEIDRSLFLEGDVRVSQGAFEVSGAQARYNQAEGQVSVQGPLVSRGQGFLMTGDSAEYQVDSGRFDINTATFLIHAAEMRGTAGSLTRLSASEVMIEDGMLTTCGPQRNDWAVVASEINLNQAEGFGTARHVRLEVLDVPVFYWPWASFPIDDRRKTGFLYPEFGSSSAGSGGFLALPYYLNLAPHYDATLTPQYIHGRGLFNEVELFAFVFTEYAVYWQRREFFTHLRAREYWFVVRSGKRYDRQYTHDEQGSDFH